MVRTARTFSAAIALSAAVVLLAACGGQPGAPTTMTPTVTVTVTSSPTSSPTATAAPADLPTSCGSIGSPATRAETVGDLTLQGDGVGLIRPVPQDATLALGCEWIVGDATGIVLLISSAPAANVEAAIPGLAAQGYTCQTSDDFGAHFCSSPGSGPDDEETIVARDGVWIYMDMVNRNGRAFLSEIVQGILG